MTNSAPHATSASQSPGVASRKDETIEEVAAGATVAFPSRRPRQDATGTHRSVVVSGRERAPLRKRYALPLLRDADLYFIRNDALGIIKIGVAGNVEDRHRSLERGCGVPLVLLGVVKGGACYERDLLEVFDETRLLGEWFRPSDDLLDVIANPDSILEAIAYAWPQVEARRRETTSVRP